MVVELRKHYCRDIFKGLICETFYGAYLFRKSTNSIFTNCPFWRDDLENPFFKNYSMTTANNLTNIQQSYLYLILYMNVNPRTFIIRTLFIIFFFRYKSISFIPIFLSSFLESLDELKSIDNGVFGIYLLGIFIIKF